jgi:hypothetical protein
MVTAADMIAVGQVAPLCAGDQVDAQVCHRVRQRLVLHHCKWDPQVGDVETIARFPLILSAGHWRNLSRLGELLCSELMAAERELTHRADLHRTLGLPAGLRRVFQQAGRIAPTPPAARVMRFDFHWTDCGWKISEVNSDVPGGFCEASELPRLMVPHFPGTKLAGDPGSAWADAIAAAALARRPVALLSAPGYMEDRQVLACLANLLGERQIASMWTDPRQLRWDDGWASAQGIPLGAIIRFYQAEWLPIRSVPELFIGGKTPVGNPGIAALTESKRFPLVWDSLATPLPTWKQLLPETRDPREAAWRTDESWLVKSAMCNTGDTVAIRSLMTGRQWGRVQRAVWWNPGTWIAQRRFASTGINSPAGEIHPCIGVYTVNGKTAGIYGRYSHRPLIDYAAVDVAVLVEEEEAE